MKNKRKLPKYRYIVKVQFVNGNRASYRLPIDVSHGLDKDYKDFGNYILNNAKINYDNSECNLLEKL